MFSCGSHRFDDEGWRRVAEGGKDAAGMEPARAEPAKDVVPIKIAGLELACRRVTTIGSANRSTHPETALGEVQPVAHAAADSVIGNPFDELGIDASLQNKILEQPAHVVVCKSGANGGLQPEAAPQSAGDIVFAAAFPDFELARRAHTPLAWIEPEHDFPERNQIVLAGTGRFDVQNGDRIPCGKQTVKLGLCFPKPAFSLRQLRWGRCSALPIGSHARGWQRRALLWRR